jgi:carbon starvation protein
MTVIILIAGLLIYVLFYATFGKFLEKKVIKADPGRITPAHRLYDCVDCVPAKNVVLFGHHFASIAGAAPIIGPVIALAWGWLPALLWIWLGNIFIGAVHDYLALMASVRRDGKSIQFIAADLLDRRTGMFILWFVLFLLILVVASFSAIIAKTFVSIPSVASANIMLIIAALIEGVLMYKMKMGLKKATIIGIIMVIASIMIGAYFPIRMPYSPDVQYKLWMVVLFAYIILASAIPVNMLLQPRDYLNSWLLYAGMILGLIGGAGCLSAFTVPALTHFTVQIEGNPIPFWPVIPLIVACGSLSGFHSLVASGTSSKQIDKETDGLFIGFGAMLTEGYLSTLVIVAVSAFGLVVFREKITDGSCDVLMKDWAQNYDALMNRTGGPVALFSSSYAKMIHRTLPFMTEHILSVLSALWVSAFALTTLDTTNRIARYILVEISDPIKEKMRSMHRVITNRWLASFIPALLGLILAWNGLWQVIWPAFGAANQLLASIALVTGTLWLIKDCHVRKSLWIFLPSFLLWLTVTSALAWFIIVVLPGHFVKDEVSGVLLMVISLCMMTINLFLFMGVVKKYRQETREGD